MKEKTVLFASKEWMSAEKASAFLRELADKLTQETVVFRRDGEELSLAVPAEMMLEVKVDEKKKADGTKVGIEIELEWKEGKHGGVSLG